MKKLESRTVSELVALAREWGVSGYSRLKKAELVKLLAKRLPKGVRLREPAPAGKKKSGGGSRQVRMQASRARLGKTVPEKGSRPAIERSGKSYHKPQIKAKNPEAVPRWRPESERLPDSYGDGRMGLLPRDPLWLYCFWDLTDEQSRRLWQGDRACLRVVEVADGKEREVERLVVSAGSMSWYVQVEEASRTYRCDLGLAGPADAFEIVLSSNLSTTPPDGVSDLVEANFVPVEGAGESPETPAAEPVQQADRFYALSAGAQDGAGMDSAGALAAMRDRLAGALASDVLHSAGLAREK